MGQRLQAPMVHALRGKEHVERDNPYDVGMTGLIGFSSGCYAAVYVWQRGFHRCVVPQWCGLKFGAPPRATRSG